MQLIDPQTIELGSIETHKKASSIAFYNPANQLPYVNIVEDTVDATGNRVMNVDPKSFLINYGDVEKFPLVNPVTGESLGKDISVDEVMAIMYSLYVHVRELKSTTDIEEPVA